MISVVIIEDDFASSDHLIARLKELNEDMEVRAVLRSVAEAVEYLGARTDVDLIFSDIRLSDGLSFQVFEEVSIRCPVIFVSAYDQYLVNAFEYGGIDYILKPASTDALAASIGKYRTLQKHFTENNAFIKRFMEDYLTTKRTRIIVKKGASNISLLLSDVVFFYTENLVVYVYDSRGGKYLIDKSLNNLENELDPKSFFRANRQYIVNINYIQGYKNYERVKLLVSLTVKDMDHVIVVGQEKAKLFRHWLAEA